MPSIRCSLCQFFFPSLNFNTIHNSHHALVQYRAPPNTRKDANNTKIYSGDNIHQPRELCSSGKEPGPSEDRVMVRGHHPASRTVEFIYRTVTQYCLCGRPARSREGLAKNLRLSLGGLLLRPGWFEPPRLEITKRKSDQRNSKYIKYKVKVGINIIKSWYPMTEFYITLVTYIASYVSYFTKST